MNSRTGLSLEVSATTSRASTAGVHSLGEIQQVDHADVLDDLEHEVKRVGDGRQTKHGDCQPHDVADGEPRRKGNRPVQAAAEHARNDGGDARSGRCGGNEQRRREDEEGGEVDHLGPTTSDSLVSVPRGAIDELVLHFPSVWRTAHARKSSTAKRRVGG